MKIAIYEFNSLLKNAGGPAGYLWHLNEGLNEVGHEGIEFIFGQQWTEGEPSPFAGHASRVKAVSPTLWRLGKSFLPTKLREEWLDLYSRRLEDYYLPPHVEKRLEQGGFDALHCHCTLHALMGHNSLVRLGIRSRTKLVLTSHCPEKPADERVKGYVDHGLSSLLVPMVRKRLDAIDERAIQVVDHVVFPCVEAQQMYEAFWPGFRELIAGKPVSYVITGIVDIGEQEAFAWQGGRPGEGVLVCYAGRHNSVKGYDLLIEATLPLLDRDDIKVVVAGNPGAIPAPQHPNWIEIGWTRKVHSLIQSCDIFVLPNRSTYFDLVALEAMALGRPLVATDTGGNKALARFSDGILLCEPTSVSIRARIEEAIKDRAQLALLGARNRAAFLEHLRAGTFASNYKSTMASIVSL
jgi:glycosyltransferase involved in cell wall biosynthesis